MWMQAIQSMLPRPEGRSNEQIEDDLDTEFAFHIEQSTREFIETGQDPEAARGLARQRFGDISAIEQRCKRIALEERIMLQRVNFVMMLVVLVMVVGVGIQVFITQRYNTLALQAITSELTRMKYDTSADERRASADASTEFVYVDGDVVRPGVYVLPREAPLTLRRLTAAMGGIVNNNDAQLTVSAIGADGKSRVKFKMEHVKDQTSVDYTLSAGDHVHVEIVTKGESDRRASSSQPAANLPNSTERVLVEGDVETPGWYPIDMDHGTLLTELLNKLKVRDDQWVRYKRADTTSFPTSVPALDARNSWPKRVLRPGEELRIDDDVPDRTKRSYWVNRWKGDGIGEWVEVDDQNQVVADGWTMHSYGKGSAKGLFQHPSRDLTLILAFRDAGLSLQAKGSTSPFYSGQWSMAGDNIVLDFTKFTREDIAGGPATGNMDLTTIQELNRRIVLKLMQSNPKDRAQAIGEFIIKLFAAVDPNDPDINKTIREVLDQSEREIDLKYANDPVTARMIGELIAGRRKILESDARGPTPAGATSSAADAHAKALSSFLNQLVASADPNARELKVDDLLVKAAAEAETKLADQPEVLARVRETIAQQRKAIEDKDRQQPAATQP